MKLQGRIKRLGWKKLALGAGAIVLGIAIVLSLTKGNAQAPAQTDTTRTVQVRSVAELSSEGTVFSIAGIASSKSEATVRTESAGQVTRLYYELGDSVGAGAIVAELENSSQRASVLQAEGVLDAAKASGGISETTLSTARTGAFNTLLSAYATVEDTVRGDADPMFSNPESVQPDFKVTSSDSQAVIDTENNRVTLSTLLARQQGRSATLSTSDNLAAELVQTEKELQQVRTFFDRLIIALNTGVPTYDLSQTTIDSFKATATAARTSVTTSLSAINTARQTLEAAEKNLDNSGASNASIKQAEGALAAARANLEKTIIRAPISGTINSLSLKRGDYVQLSSPVLTVANNGALEVVAYITQNDVARITVGDSATIDEGAKGSVTRIAPALDPITKKIEVRIGITSGSNTLVNGQSVVVSFIKSSSAAQPTKGPITLPITALKIGTDEIVVFTVDVDNKLISHPVVLGTLMGDRVVVESGVTPDMQIVFDARGLQAGETVNVQ